MKRQYKLLLLLGLLLFFIIPLIEGYHHHLEFSLINQDDNDNENNENENDQSNVYNRSLQICGTDPITGFYRDGYCNTGPTDSGTHTVCAEMTEEFLNYTKSRGNDLSTPRGSFSGLVEGDNWCLCAYRWKQAYDNNVSPLVNLEATNIKTLDPEFNITIDQLNHN